jgi:hypothetical protein
MKKRGLHKKFEEKDNLVKNRFENMFLIIEM